MAEVEIIIGGFAHRVVCAEGQEPRIQMLGQRIAREITNLAERNPGHSPTRLLLLAALHFADQVDELERRHTQAVLHGEPSPKSADESQNASTARAQEQVLEATQLYLAQVFDEMARRLEGLDRDLASVEARLPLERDLEKNA